MVEYIVADAHVQNLYHILALLQLFVCMQPSCMPCLYSPNENHESRAPCAPAGASDRHCLSPKQPHPSQCAPKQPPPPWERVEQPQPYPGRGLERLGVFRTVTVTVCVECLMSVYSSPAPYGLNWRSPITVQTLKFRVILFSLLQFTLRQRLTGPHQSQGSLRHICCYPVK